MPSVVAVAAAAGLAVVVEAVAGHGWRPAVEEPLGRPLLDPTRVHPAWGKHGRTSAVRLPAGPMLAVRPLVQAIPGRNRDPM